MHFLKDVKNFKKNIHGKREGIIMRLWHKDLISVLPREQLIDAWEKIYLQRIKRKAEYEYDF